ncbi:MAG: septation regulator SpoVG [Spirochaetota bacterium]
MEITDIRVRKVDTQGKLKAYVTVTFDSCFVVHNVKVIEGGDRVFIAMPSRKTKNGDFKDVAHPITSEFRNMLQEKIVAAYEAEDGPLPDSAGGVQSGDDIHP